MGSRATVLALLLAAGSGCGDASDDTTASTMATGAGGSNGTGGIGGGSAGDGGAADDPCSADALEEPKVDTTYFVAIDEPGADNDACNGKAPTDEGGGRCPFKDLSSSTVRALIDGASSVRLELRAGTYAVTGWDGLRVTGTGASAEAPVVVSSHRGEHVVLDVPSPDGTGCTDETAPTNPDCVRQVVRVSGQHTVVQGLTIQNGLGYDFEVNGGADHLVRCNKFTYTARFAQRSDSLKIDGGAQGTTIRDNEFTQWHSQAIDITGVTGVVIERNEFHDPFDADGGATGTKFGARDVVIRDNDVHDLGAGVGAHVFSLGGTGTPHPDAFEASDVHVIGNRVHGVRGILAQLVSCEACSIEDNDVSDLGAGILLSAAATGLPECSGAATGLLGATTGARIRGNRIRRLDGGGDPGQANIFVVVEAGQGGALFGGDNVYCAPSADDARFGWEGQLLSFSAWIEASGTDETSAAVAATDDRCTSR